MSDTFLMNTLPREVQDQIKQYVPKFIRLSKNEYVGTDCLIKQCYLPITKKEVINYLNKYDIESFIIFSHSAYKGVYIDIFTCTKNYNILGYQLFPNTYNKCRCKLELEQGNHLFFHVALDDNEFCGNIVELKSYNDFLPDISTAFKIVENLRKECNKIIPKLRKTYYHYYIDNIVNYLNYTGFHYWDHTKNDLAIIASKVYRLFVLVVNYNIMIKNKSTVSYEDFYHMNTILSQITMDDHGMLLNNNAYLLDEIIDTYVEKIHNYIDVML